ncbi:MAG TPA: mechanosensitive ion channel family protein [Flavobacteriaceae bacterium]|nr:mechanosensitive ion channel family protein [Flavobacteriaceae bacterium]
MISLQTAVKNLTEIEDVAKAQKYLNKAIDSIVTYLPSAIGAILVLWIGFKVINKIMTFIETLLNKSSLSDTIRPFIRSVLGVILKVSVILAAAGIAGVDLTIFGSIIAASVLAIGLSLQGSLGNLASGLLVLTTKPFKVNDWIDVDGKFGKVTEISILNTIVLTPGKKTLIMPNSLMTSSVITNYSETGVVRLEIDITMPYAESYPKVKKIIIEAISNIPNILESPKTEIGIEGYDSHSIQVAVRPYVKPDDFWEVTFACYENIKKAFSENNIQVAYSEGVELGSIGE